MAPRRGGREPIVSEPVPIVDVFATGLAEIERGDGFIRLTFYADRALVIEGDEIVPVTGTERMVVARLVLPSAAYQDILRRLAWPYRLHKRSGDGDGGDEEPGSRLS